MDPQRLRQNFEAVAAHGIDVAEYFYADLFYRNPEYRSLFPASMNRQQRMLLDALTNIVALVDNPTELVPYVEQLGRTHRGYGITESHYSEVGVSLISTLRYFSADAWDEHLEKDWTEAYSLVADVMIGASPQEA